VAGLRYRIGVDTVNYMAFFQSYPTLNELDFKFYDVEPLWLLLNAACKTIYDDFVLVQLVQAAIVNISVFWFIKKYSPKPFLAILLYYIFQWWNFNFEVMREAIAVAFYLYALDALISKKSITKYYLRVWPACLFHSIGFITLLFPLIQFLKFRKTTFIVFGVLIVFAFSFSDQLNLITSLFMGEGVANKVEGYLESEVYGESGLSFMGVIAYILGNILPVSLVLYVFYKNRKIESISRFVPYLLIFLLIVVLRFKIAIFYRFFNYFEIMVIVALTQAADSYSYARSKLYSFMGSLSIYLMLSFKIYQFYKPVVSDVKQIKVYQRYYPYNSVFEKTYNPDTEWIFRIKGR